MQPRFTLVLILLLALATPLAADIDVHLKDQAEPIKATAARYDSDRDEFVIQTQGTRLTRPREEVQSLVADEQSLREERDDLRARLDDAQAKIKDLETKQPDSGVLRGDTQAAAAFDRAERLERENRTLLKKNEALQAELETGKKEIQRLETVLDGGPTYTLADLDLASLIVRVDPPVASDTPGLLDISGRVTNTGTTDYRLVVIDILLEDAQGRRAALTSTYLPNIDAGATRTFVADAEPIRQVPLDQLKVYAEAVDALPKGK